MMEKVERDKLVALLDALDQADNDVKRARVLAHIRHYIDQMYAYTANLEE